MVSVSALYDNRFVDYTKVGFILWESISSWCSPFCTSFWPILLHKNLMPIWSSHYIPVHILFFILWISVPVTPVKQEVKQITAEIRATAIIEPTSGSVFLVRPFFFPSRIKTKWGLWWSHLPSTNLLKLGRLGWPLRRNKNTITCLITGPTQRC